MAERSEEQEQQVIHDAIESAMRENGQIDDDQVLTGWIVGYELQGAARDAEAGLMYGPAGMTTWRAMGLVEWGRRFCLQPGESDNG